MDCLICLHSPRTRTSAPLALHVHIKQCTCAYVTYVVALTKNRKHFKSTQTVHVIQTSNYLECVYINMGILCYLTIKILTHEK